MLVSDVFNMLYKLAGVESSASFVTPDAKDALDKECAKCLKRTLLHIVKNDEKVKEYYYSTKQLTSDALDKIENAIEILGIVQYLSNSGTLRRLIQAKDSNEFSLYTDGKAYAYPTFYMKTVGDSVAGVPFVGVRVFPKPLPTDGMFFIPILRCPSTVSDMDLNKQLDYPEGFSSTLFSVLEENFKRSPYCISKIK